MLAGLVAGSYWPKPPGRLDLAVNGKDRRVVGLGRVELPTRSLGNCCSIHLSYSPIPKGNFTVDWPRPPMKEADRKPTDMYCEFTAMRRLSPYCAYWDSRAALRLHLRPR